MHILIIFLSKRDAFLFSTIARNRIQAICDIIPFQKDTIEIVKSDEPKLHMENILKRMNEKLNLKK